MPFDCRFCERSFHHESDLIIHEKARHMLNEEISEGTRGNCGFYKFKLDNWSSYVDGQHQDREYDNQIDHSQVQTHAESSSLVRQKTKQHDYTFNQDQNRVSSNRSPGFVLPSQASAPRTQNDVPGRADSAKKLAVKPSVPKLRSPIAVFGDSLRLCDLRPMSHASAERPTLPGVRAIEALCTGQDEVPTIAGNVFSSRTLPPLQSQPSSRPSPRCTQGKHAVTGADPSSNSVHQPGANLRAQNAQAYSTARPPVHYRTAMKKITRGGKEYLVSYQMCVQESKQ